MERVDKILLAENTMKISEKPVPIHELKNR